MPDNTVGGSQPPIQPSYSSPPPSAPPAVAPPAVTVSSDPTGVNSTPDAYSTAGSLDFQAGDELDDLGAGHPSFAQSLAGLPPEQVVTQIYTQMLGRQPSSQELGVAMKNWDTLVNTQKQSPAGATQEFIKSALNSSEFQIKQGREQLNMRYGMPVQVAGPDGPVDFLWGSQTTGPGGARFYHGQELPYGPVSYKDGLNFMMEYMCNGTSGNPLMNMMRGFGKDDVSRTGLGSPAFEELTRLGQELYHLGWGGTDHYGFDGSRRDVNSDAGKADPNLRIDNPNPIRSPQDMVSYLDQRIGQLDKLASRMDPLLDSPMAMQTVQQMRTMLMAGRTFCQQIASGATRATIVTAVPGAKAGFYAGGNPSQPLPGELSDWQALTNSEPQQAYQHALKDPASYVSQARSYFLG